MGRRKLASIPQLLERIGKRLKEADALADFEFELLKDHCSDCKPTEAVNDERSICLHDKNLDPGPDYGECTRANCPHVYAGRE